MGKKKPTKEEWVASLFEKAGRYLGYALENEDQGWAFYEEGRLDNARAHILASMEHRQRADAIARHALETHEGKKPGKKRP